MLFLAKFIIPWMAGLALGMWLTDLWGFSLQSITLILAICVVVGWIWGAIVYRMFNGELE